jgi:hypothetical protein
MAAKRRAGERVGMVLFGWSLDDDGVTLVPCQEEQKVIAAMLRCREAGMSYRAIASILTGEGVITKQGAPRWTHTTVRSILTRWAALAA